MYRPLVLEPVASVAKNSLYVDPTSGALMWRDGDGTAHTIALPGKGKP